MYLHLPRQGPGDDESTAHAFSYLKNVPDTPSILDIGCGAGGQTLALTKLMPKATITAVDRYDIFLNVLRENAKAKGVADRINAGVGDMTNLKLPEKSFDIIWSEGSAYIMGFENALKYWRGFLKEKGYMVVSDCSWTKKDVPPELYAFFKADYPGIEYFEDRFSIVKAAGYELIGHFILHKEAWWNQYYGPMQKWIEERLKSHKEDEKLFADSKKEIEIFNKYSDSYGYCFYIMRKID